MFRRKPVGSAQRAELYYDDPTPVLLPTADDLHCEWGGKMATSWG